MSIFTSHFFNINLIDASLVMFGACAPTKVPRSEFTKSEAWRCVPLSSSLARRRSVPSFPAAPCLRAHQLVHSLTWKGPRLAGRSFGGQGWSRCMENDGKWTCPFSEMAYSQPSQHDKSHFFSHRESTGLGSAPPFNTRALNGGTMWYLLSS